MMIRAVFFDFYSVWAPDRFSYYLANAQLNGPEVFKSLYDSLEQYYHGQLDVDQIAETFRYKLGHPDITSSALTLSEASISPEIVNFMRSLHSHFLKIGMLANLGAQEDKIIRAFNDHNQLFEVIASPLSVGSNATLLSREVFGKAIQAIGESPSSCLYVSGNPYYLAYAANFEIQTLQFGGLPQLQETLNQMLAKDIPQ
jgi:FMN phosphatase YigB (HAD superfamily)